MKTKKIKNLLILLSILSNACWANVVELVVPWAPGGTTDRVAHVVLRHAKPEFAKYGMILNISYKPGAAGILGANSVASTKSGDMQILLATNTVISTPMINQGVATYDVSKDFSILGYLGHAPMVTVVNSNTGISNISDFKKACQSRTLSYGTAGIGSNVHIASALVTAMFKCNATAVPYKGAAPAVTDLIGGHIDYLSDYEAGVLPHIHSGKFTALVVLDRKRSNELPGVPSIVELGYSEFNFYNWFVLIGNANADAGQLAIAQRIFDQVLSDSEVLEQLAKIGIRGRQQVAKDFLVAERKNFSQILRNANIGKQ